MTSPYTKFIIEELCAIMESLPENEWKGIQLVYERIVLPLYRKNEAVYQIHIAAEKAGFTCPT